MKLSHLELAGLSVGGMLVVATLLVAVNSSTSNLVQVDSGSLLAEASAASPKSPGQVVLWGENGTLTGNAGLAWDNFNNNLVVSNVFSGESINLISPGRISLRSGNGRPGNPIYLSGGVYIAGGGLFNTSLELLGGMRMIDSGNKPTCNNQSNLGTFWFSNARNAILKDTVEVCARDTRGVPGWQKLY